MSIRYEVPLPADSGLTHLELSPVEAVTALRCDLAYRGRTTLWRFEPENPDTVRFQVAVTLAWPGFPVPVPRIGPHSPIETWLAALDRWRAGEPFALPARWLAAWGELRPALRAEAIRRLENERAHRRRLTVLSRQVDLLTLIAETVALQRRGRRWVGRCPFHEDDTPSLSVDPEKGWYCFGCGRGGKQGTWIQELRRTA